MTLEIPVQPNANSHPHKPIFLTKNDVTTPWQRITMLVVSSLTFGYGSIASGSANLRLVTLIFLMGLLHTNCKAELAWDVSQLMQTLASNPAPRLAFVEWKYSTLLTRPLKSRGILTYTPPNQLEKHILEPYQAHYYIKGNRLRIQAVGADERILTLSYFLPLKAFVEAFRATLQGDLRTLKTYYWVDLKGTPSKWQLTLEPFDEEMAEWTTRVQIHGRDGHILRIKTLQTDGDYTLLELTEAPISEHTAITVP